PGRKGKTEAESASGEARCKARAEARSRRQSPCARQPAARVTAAAVRTGAEPAAWRIRTAAGALSRRHSLSRRLAQRVVRDVHESLPRKFAQRNVRAGPGYFFR